MFLESHLNHPMRNGSIEVICGSMFSGKTEELLRRLKRANFAKLKVEIYKPNIKTKMAENIEALDIASKKEPAIINTNNK